MEKHFLVTKKRLLVITISLFAFIYWGILCADTSIVFLCRAVVFIIFLYCINKGISEECIFNPYFYYCLVPLSLLVYNPSISSKYLLALDVKVWIFAISNMIAFLLAMNATRVRARYIDRELVCKEDGLAANRCGRHALILFAIYTMMQLPRMLTGTVLPLYSTLTLLVYPALALAWKSKNRFLIFALYGLTFIFVINSLNKTALLFIVMITVYSYWKYHDEGVTKLWKLVLATVLGAVLMLIVFNYKAYLQLGGDFKSFINGGIFTYSLADTFLESGSVSWSYSKSLAMPYMYLVQAWNNVQYVLETQPSSTYGLWFIKPVLGWLTVEDYFSLFYELRPYSIFNTYTYMIVLFKDFGLYFAWIGSAFLGWFVKSYYNKFVSSDCPFTVGCYALISCATFEMFFSNHFFQQSYPFTIVVLVTIYKALMVNGKRRI